MDEDSEGASSEDIAFAKLFEALHELYSGPQYANGRSAGTLPILRRFHPELRPPGYVVLLSSAERTAVQEFRRAFERTARDQNVFSREGTEDAMQEEFSSLLGFLSMTIPALARAGLGRDVAYQRLVLSIMQLFLDGLKGMVDIDDSASCRACASFYGLSK